MKTLKEMTDEELAIAYGKGNNRAFDLLLARNQEKLYSYIMFIVGDTNIADDIFQDTFVKVITRVRQGSYTTSGKFSAWLTRIAHNIIIDMYRDKSNGRLVEAGTNNDLSNISTADIVDMSIEMKLIKERNYHEALLIMEALPTPQRDIVYMRFFQELSFKEIAETTGMSINTALGRMRYAIQNMRRMAMSHNMCSV